MALDEAKCAGFTTLKIIFTNTHCFASHAIGSLTMKLVYAGDWWHVVGSRQ
jgi:hypothetical protein